jgi:tetratricopeptide (TPR) repeat protein
MQGIKKALVLAALVTIAAAQSPEPPLSDTRLSIHTLVREDIFAGFLSNNAERFARGEKNLQLLLEKRPDAKPELLAWQGGAALYKAVLDYENKRSDEFQQKYQQALDLFSQAQKLGPQNGGVFAVMGGSYAVFADRLPKDKQAAAWAQAYDAYQLLWKAQGASVDRLPVHMRGELLGGLAQSAQRTGHAEEVQKHLDKILAVLPGTPYEPVAKQWKADPKSAANSSITCLTCHDGGRLAARLAVLNKQ